MAKCDYCNSSILFGGVKRGNLRFCNARCNQNGLLLNASHQLSPELVKQQIDQVHQGQCPKCRGRGPVDVHTSHQVYSVIVLTRWSSKPQISCRSCGVKSQLGGIAVSLLFGWWGFPWGLIFTPVQITKNLVSMFNAPNAMRPSPQLEKLIRLNIASRLISAAPAKPKDLVEPANLPARQ